MCLSLLTSCTTAPITNMPSWTGKWYEIDPSKAALVRKQDGEIISCAEVRAAGFLAVSPTDYLSFYNTYILGCDHWVAVPPGAVVNPVAPGGK